MTAVARRPRLNADAMDSLPDEIARKIADMKIAADYCSLTVYDNWGVLFWVSRTLAAAPWFCKVALPDEATRFTVTGLGVKPSSYSNVRVQWLPALTLRTKAALQLVVAERLKDHAHYQDRQNFHYYYSQTDEGIPPSYMASGFAPWMTEHTGGEQIAPVPPFSGCIEEPEHAVWTDAILETRVNRIMSVIETLVGTM